MSGRDLARKDILALRGYKAAEQLPDTVRLNANEAPQPLRSSNIDLALNRYPEVHPVRLQTRMADLLSVPAENLLVTRGSSEAIDLLVRAFCRAYEDNLITASPTFEMYRFFADVQGIELREVPLRPEQNFSLDIDAVLDRCTRKTKLIFVCSPNNPTGGLVTKTEIARLVEARRDQSVVVVDEAYIEFSDQESLAADTSRHDNLVVLRTLSKAHALAGARCGAAIACPELIDVFARVLPPYSFPTPVVSSVLDTLSGDEPADSTAAIADIISERERIFTAIGELSFTARIWPSQANFLLVQFEELERLQAHLLNRKVLVRDFVDEKTLENCARITIGSADENDALLKALAEFETTL